MHRTRSKLIRSAAVLIAAAIAACATPSKSEEDQGRPTSSRLTFAEEWSAAIHDMGKFPVYPPTEDVYVGDVFAFSTPPTFASVKNAEGLRTAATPRWKSLNVLAQLESEYSQRPTWPRGGEAVQAPGESLYRADRVPIRHRVVALRSMLKVTLRVPDLEPFIPIEIAPLIGGPATPARFAVSVQAGDAEIYSLSVDTVVEQLLDVTEGPEGSEGSEGTTFSLKPEYLGNLPLVADPVTGKAYLVVLTEVLYMRSLEATVRKRATPVADESEDADESADAGGEQTAQEPVETAPADPAETGPGASDEVDPHIAAIQRAEAMNEAFGESGIKDRTGGTLRIVMATEEAITLRRDWPYPLAVAVRGITLEVDVSTGSVPRMSPLGIPLPKLPPPAPEPEPDQEPEQEPEETEPDEGS